METPRLVLRTLRKDDASVLSALRSNAEVNRYLDRNNTTSVSECAAFIARINAGCRRGAWAYWAICLKTQELIGTICLWNFSADRKSAELGFELLPAHHGRGYMDEAVKAILEHGFQVLGLQAIRASTHRENAPATRLLLKNHFQNLADDKPDGAMLNYSLRREAHFS